VIRFADEHPAHREFDDRGGEKDGQEDDELGSGRSEGSCRHVAKRIKCCGWNGLPSTKLGEFMQGLHADETA